MKGVKVNLYVGGVLINDLSPEDRDKFESKVIEKYEEIILQKVDSMMAAGRSKKEIMKYLTIA